MKTLSIITLLALFAIPHTADACCRGCGCRGGPGWRKANGQCASWADGGGGGYVQAPTPTTYVSPIPVKPKRVEAPKKKKPYQNFEWAVKIDVSKMEPVNGNTLKTNYFFKSNHSKTKGEQYELLKTEDGWTCKLSLSQINGDSYFRNQWADVICSNGKVEVSALTKGKIMDVYEWDNTLEKQDIEQFPPVESGYHLTTESGYTLYVSLSICEIDIGLCSVYKLWSKHK